MFAVESWLLAPLLIGSKRCLWCSPTEDPGPDPPRDDDQRVRVIPAEKQDVIFAEPALERGEAGAVLSPLYFSHQGRLLAPEWVEVHVMSGAAKPAGAGERVALGMDADFSVPIDDLAFEARPFLTMAGAALTSTPSTTSA